MGVASFGIEPYVIVVNTKLGVNTLSELLAYLKAHPGKLNVPTSGNNSAVTADLFKQATGADFSLINYSGTGPAATSLLSGETDFAILDSSSFHSVDPEREKALAIAADVHMDAFPGVPTTAEAGLPGFTATALFGLFMPGGTPPEITDRINAEINKIVVMPKVAEQLQAQGLIIKTMSRPEADAKYQSDLIMWKDVVTKAKIPLLD
jgi:tripartite-type tricarboxylate transporter receptor subunit TctC